MRLRLIAETDMPDTDKGWRLLERGELTLGRDPSCHWTLPDPMRTVSKVHCRLRRDATGFTVTDESTNGMRVDRRELTHSETVRLATNSVITFCGQRFRVEITGEVEPDWQDPDAGFALGDDVPSVTAILSDVSPGGTTASGILPGRGGEENWLDSLGAGTDAPPGGAERASRPTIGWSEPLDLGITGGTQLPDDWDTEAATSSRAEHRLATATRMRVPRPLGAEPVPVLGPVEPASFGAGPSAGEALDAFLRGSGGLDAPAGDPVAALEQAGQAFRRMREVLATVDQSLAEFFEEAGAGDGTRLQAADEALPERLAERQQQLLFAMRALLSETEALDPSQIEMKVRVTEAKPAGLAARIPLPGRPERAALALYRRLYAGEDNTRPSARFARRLRGEMPGAAADPAGDDFVELSADRPRYGDM